MYENPKARRTLFTIVVTWLAGSCAINEEAAFDANTAGKALAKNMTMSAKDVEASSKDPGTKTAEEVFPNSTLGLRLNRSIVVRSEPSLDSEKLGTVAAHTIVGWRDATTAEGCESRWIAIEPKGWVCQRYLEPVKQEPHGVELPKLGTAESVPGTYGKVIGEDAVVVTSKDGTITSESGILSASTVRKRGTTIIEGRPYWKIDGGKYISQALLRLHRPSEFGGVRLQGVSPVEMPMAFAFSGNQPGGWVTVRNDKNRKVRRLEARALVSIKDTILSSNNKPLKHRIGDNEFVLAKDLRMVTLFDPPDRTNENERWIDIDLTTQILVAYEGSLPIYATLISSGTRKNPTETGIFRIRIKFSETTMSGRMGESDAYSVATVPWTQFYENDFALHTSYWHDRFGQQRSHGCVNLSPKDARFVYFWSDPQVPIGWSMANSSTTAPGSIVRVHSKADPEPEFKGRAKAVYDARQ